MRAWVGLLPLCACSATVDIPEPPLSGKARALLVFLDGQVHAVDRERAGSGTMLPVGPEIDRPLRVLAYRCPLEVLGLTEGAQTLRAPAAHPARTPHLDPEQGFEATLGAGEVGAWTTLDVHALPAEVEAQLAQLEVRPDAPCRRFVPELRVTPLAIPDTREVALSFAVALSSSEALLATTDGRFFRVGDAGAVPLTSLSTRTPHLAAYRAADGELWLLGQGMSLARGHPDRGGFTPVLAPQGPEPSSYAWLDGGPVDGEMELYAATDWGRVHHFRRGAWSKLYDLGRRQEAVNGVLMTGGVAWTAPGTGYAVDPEDWTLAVATPTSPTKPSARRLLGTEVHELPLGPAPMQFPMSLANLPSYGVVLGSFLGELHRPTADGWSLIGTSPLGVSALVISEWRGLIFFGGRSGAISAYHPRGDYCAPINVNPDARAIVPLAERVLVASRPYLLGAGNQAVSWLDPISEPGESRCGD